MNFWNIKDNPIKHWIKCTFKASQSVFGSKVCPIAVDSRVDDTIKILFRPERGNAILLRGCSKVELVMVPEEGTTSIDIILLKKIEN